MLSHLSADKDNDTISSLVFLKLKLVQPKMFFPRFKEEIKPPGPTEHNPTQHEWKKLTVT